MNENNNIIIYQSEDGKTHIEVKLEENTVWLTQQQIADLYQTYRSNITEHFYIYMKKESWMKKQLVGNSDRFDKMVIGK